MLLCSLRRLIKSIEGFVCSAGKNVFNHEYNSELRSHDQRAYTQSSARGLKVDVITAGESISTQFIVSADSEWNGCIWLDTTALIDSTGNVWNLQNQGSLVTVATAQLHQKTTKTPQKLYKTIQSINTTLQICMIENLFPCELGDDGRIDHGGNNHNNAKAVSVAARLQQKRCGLRLTDSHSSLSGCRIWLHKRR